MSIVTCHTDGCPSEGVPIDLTTTWTNPDTGEEMPVDAVHCGACGEAITDIQPSPPAEE